MYQWAIQCTNTRDTVRLGTNLLGVVLQPYAGPEAVLVQPFWLPGWLQPAPGWQSLLPPAEVCG